MAIPAEKSIAENGAFVLVAYFLVFGIWTAASGNDFISSTWKSVSTTRRRGQTHVVLVFVPMIYMSVYIYFQYQNRDFQEMGAALLALAFAILHLLRTITGLWQLHIFKQWAMASIKSMESLGFKTFESSSDRGNSSAYGDDLHGQIGGDGVDIHGYGVNSTSQIHDLTTGLSDREDVCSDDSDHCPLSSDSDAYSTEEEFHTGETTESEEIENPVVNASTRRHCMPGCLKKSSSETQGERIERLADEILVNDSLIDNRLSDVPTACYLQWFSKGELKALRREKLLIKRLLLQFWCSFLNIFRFVNILLSLTFCRTPCLQSSESGPRIFPCNPETIWLRWATALVAQADWMKDLDGGIMPTDPDASADYEDHRNQFAEQILLSAALHSDRAESRKDKLCGGKGSCDTVPGFLPFRDWRKYPHLCSGKFSKQEFLHLACRRGSGLPFMAPHREAIGSSGIQRCGYKNFKSELRRACEALPAGIEARVSEFDVEKLEWFTIFVSVEDWARGRENKKTEQEDKLDSGLNVAGDEKDTESENDIPIENLRMQLGFSKDSDFSIRRFKFPLLRNVSKKTLWGNRNVLEVSCHIDNWLALCAGEHTSFMVEHVPWMERKCLLESMSKVSSDSADGTSETDRVVNESIDLEKCKFLCQMAVLEPENAHFEKSATFLGCSMEMLRSSLARWAENAKNQEESTWKPALPTVPGNAIDPFRASDDLTACLRNVHCISDLAERYIQMRTIWEVQNQMHNRLPKDGVAPSSVEAMVLCVLSFPALSIDVREATGDAGISAIRERRENCILDLGTEQDGYFGVGDYEFVIRSTCGPQDVSVLVSLTTLCDIKDMFLSVRICSDLQGTNSTFQWQAWRDCFYGRLEGSRLWQERLGFTNLPLLRTAENIWTEVEKTRGRYARTGPYMNVWKGWIPPRPSICLFEIATPGFVMQSVKAKGVDISILMSKTVADTFIVPRETWRHVAYEDAIPLSVKHASLVGQELIKRAAERVDTPIMDESNGDESLNLLMLEVSALELGDAEALEKAVELLVANGCTSNSIVRGVRLIEQFYVSENINSNTSERSSRRFLHRFFKDKSRVNIVQSLFEKILVESRYDHLVSARYMRFLLMLSYYANSNVREFACASVFKSLVFRGHLRQTTRAAFAISDFSRTLFSDISEEFAVQNLACRNLMRWTGVTREEKLLGYSIGRWKEVKAETMSDLGICIQKLAEKEEGDYALQCLGLNLRSALELHKRAIAEGGFANSLTCLGGLLQEGGNGVKKDVAQAVKLYEKAIDQEGYTQAMTYLAELLFKGSEGVERNFSRAVELYQRVIDEEQSPFSMHQLAVHLSENCNATQDDIRRAIQLYERCIEESYSSTSKNNLALIFAHGAQGVEPDLPRAAQLFSEASELDGNFIAMTYLADLLVRGGKALEKNVPRAVKLYERAIDDGHFTRAMHQLAVLLERPEHGMQDLPRAVQLYSRSIAEGDDCASLNNLGLLLARGGKGVEKDLPRAMGLYTRAIEESGSVAAMVNLADLLATEKCENEKDLSRAEHLYQCAIDEGESSRIHAMHQLAVLLERRRDIHRAVHFYTRAITEGQSTCSMNNFACLLLRGTDGLEADIPRAIDLFTRAIEKDGNVGALTNLADYFRDEAAADEQNAFRAVGHYENAVKKWGNYHAMHELAVVLMKGEHGVTKDIPRAVQLYTRAATEGHHVMSMHKLGFLYSIGGYGVHQDIPRAVELFTSAVDKGGVVQSMVALADLLKTGGEGIKRDIPRAANLYQRAIAEGKSRDAMNQLGILLQRGEDGLRKDLPRAASLYKRGIKEHNSTISMGLLGFLYVQGGEGVTRDISRAVQLFERAIDEGRNIFAMIRLADVLKDGGDEVEQDIPRAKELYLRAISAGAGTYARQQLSLLRTEM